MLSWDGTLCEACRKLFDTVVVNDSWSTEPKRSFPHSSHGPDVLWQDIHSIERYAEQGCRMCLMYLSSLHPDARRAMDPWNGRLAISVSRPSLKAYRFWFLVPTQIINADEDFSRLTFSYGISLEMTVQPLVGMFPPHRRMDWNGNATTPYRQWQDISESNTRSASTFDQISLWLSHCETHEICRSWREISNISQTLPTRLLELTANQPPSVRLVDGNDMPQLHCRYATLSHCWGGKSPIQLLQRNLLSFRQNLSWFALPLTFRDAVIAALRLDIRYLWIDALCIIQDSQQDWAREAALMTHVYANGLVNISANASANSHGGLFREKSPSLGAFYLPKHKEDFPELEYVCFENTWDHDVEGRSSALSSRAWVVQERFLAPRIVHFGLKQVHWECLSITTSEELPATMDNDCGHRFRPKGVTARLFHHSARSSDKWFEKLHEIWQEWTRTYSRGRLTVASDKCIAISGLARAFCHILGLSSSDYLCGLWRPRMLDYLMWKRSLTAEGCLRRHIPTPSWSWLSFPGPISWSTDGAGNDLIARGSRPMAEILIAATITMEDPFGPVLEGFVRIRSPLCQATLSNLHGDSSLGYKRKSLILSENSLSYPVSFDLDSDACEEDNHHLIEQKVILMLVRAVTGPPFVPHDEMLGRPSHPLTSQVSYVEAGVSRPSAEMAESLTHSGSRSYESNVPLVWALGYQCLILVPTQEPATFRRLGLVSFGRSRPVQDYESPSPFDNDETPVYTDGTTARNMEERWKVDQPLLDRAFRSSDIPEHLYEEVDEDNRYVFKLV